MSSPHGMACLCREGEAASLGLDTSKQTEDALSVHAPLAVAAWKGKGSINILVSKGMTWDACSMTHVDSKMHLKLSASHDTATAFSSLVPVWAYCQCLDLDAICK
jgi:hypothetical protein